MSLLTVVQQVCAVVGVIQPTSVFSGITGNRTMAEMLECANESAQRTAWDTQDWTKFRKQAVLTGDGVQNPTTGVITGTSAFNLPADYRRMLKTANVWRSTSAQQPMCHITDTDEWMQRRAMNLTDAYGEWTMMGGQILIWPIMMGPIAATPTTPAVPAVTAWFPYLEKNCIALTSGGSGDFFLSDTDTLRLDERLLKLGMIWDWKSKKGSPYSEEMGSWSDAIANIFGADRPSPILIDRQPLSSMARVSVPSYTIYAPRTSAFP